MERSAFRGAGGPWRARPWLLVAADLGTLWLALILAYYSRIGVLSPFFSRRIQEFGDYIYPGMVVITLCMLAIAFSRLYEDRRYLSRLEEHAAVVKAIGYGMLAAFGVTFFLKVHSYSRGVFALFWAWATVLAVVERSLMHRLFKTLRRRGMDVMRVAVVCPRREVKWVKGIIAEFPEMGYRPAAWLKFGSAVGASFLRRIEGMVARGAVQGVLVGVRGREYHRVVPVLAWCEEHYVPHHRISAVFDAFHGEGDAMRDMPAVASRPLYHALKRVLDELGAAVLLVALSPLWILLAILVKVDSPGPVLFVQQRVGRHGRVFNLLKFRTLYAHSPRYAVTPRSRRDPRLTRVGAFLRRTSLDEMPQLLNVLRGEMSMVGPRPEMPFMMSKNTPEYRRRLEVLPGITGLWQAVARHEPLEESLRYDLYYIRHRSLLFDLMILARTGLTVFSGKGAV